LHQSRQTDQKEREEREKHMNIKIACICPPIPTTAYDFEAIDYDTYESGEPIGYGNTEQAALEDLIEQFYYNGDFDEVKEEGK